MNHYFTLSNKRNSHVFLPIDAVLKEESNSPTASSAPTHSYNTEWYARSKKKPFVRTIDPKDTIQQLSKKEEKQQEEAAKKMENQHILSTKDFDMDKIDVEEQKRLYEEAQRASKQSQSNLSFCSSSPQYVLQEKQDQQLVQDSNVDFVSHLGAARQQQFYGPQVVQQQIQPSSYHHQDISHHQSQLNSQLPFPQPDPVTQMARIPRAGIAENFPHNPPNYSNVRGHSPYQQMQHQYEPVPKLDQPVSYYSQQQQHPNLNSSQINPYNLEVGSMILHGNSPARSGTIKWIGYLPESNTLSAGIEMVS